MSGYFSVLSNFSFKGRATRREFWMFNLINCSLFALLCFFIPHQLIQSLAGNLPSNPSDTISIFFPILFLFAVSIQSFAVTVRRLHDLNFTGWWSLVYFTGVGLIPLAFLLCIDGTLGYNNYGTDPRGRHPMDLEPVNLNKIHSTN